MFGRDSGEAVAYAFVAGYFTTADQRVGILRLNEELDTLDGSSAGLGDSTCEATDSEI